mmetsp:Transcript_98009/g.315701  ORF Transcript_98009/g.315701 Transcript_98009/m.315701 type:complete len:94 (-) Transcript_98009:670-951(-)
MLLHTHRLKECAPPSGSGRWHHKGWLVVSASPRIPEGSPANAAASVHLETPEATNATAAAAPEQGSRPEVNFGEVASAASVEPERVATLTASP